MSDLRAKGLNHVAIAVKDLDAVVQYYMEVLGFPAPKLEEVPEQQVRVAIFGDGMGRIELICPTTTESGVAKYVAKHGEGLHHICIEVADIESTLAALQAQGVRLIDSSPKSGANGAKVAFIHPVGAHGVLTELSQGPWPH